MGKDTFRGLERGHERRTRERGKDIGERHF